jgi:hypothetical protein
VRILKLLFAFLFAMYLATNVAHARCLTGQALDNQARAYYMTWLAGQGYQGVSCVGPTCSSQTARFECASFNNPPFFRLGTTHSCSNVTATTATYTEYIHLNGWVSSGVLITCSCFGGSLTMCYQQ